MGQIPQMREVMSGASVNFRPFRNASKNRGGSKMRSFTSSTTSSLIRMKRAPSPSTRASVSILIVLLLMDVWHGRLARGLRGSEIPSIHVPAQPRGRVARASRPWSSLLRFRIYSCACPASWNGSAYEL